MAKRLALIHTVTSLVPVFERLCAEIGVAVDIFNIIDESLLQNVIKENRLSSLTARRVLSYLVSAQQAGADLIMCTCSSIGPAIDMGRPFFDLPVLRVDQPMAERAVEIGDKIGVAATLSTTLDPTASLIRSRAQAAGKDVEIVSELCEGAFEAVVSGDTEKHDAIVGAGLMELKDDVDVIVLAQASMARVVDQLPEGAISLPVLSSPRLAVEHLAEVVKDLE